MQAPPAQRQAVHPAHHQQQHEPPEVAYDTRDIAEVTDSIMQHLDVLQSMFEALAQGPVQLDDVTGSSDTPFNQLATAACLLQERVQMMMQQVQQQQTIMMLQRQQAQDWSTDHQPNAHLPEAVHLLPDQHLGPAAAAAGGASSETAAAAASGSAQVQQQPQQLPVFNQSQRWSPAEHAKLVELVAMHEWGGWAVVAAELPGRNDNECREQYLALAAKAERVSSAAVGGVPHTSREQSAALCMGAGFVPFRCLYPNCCML
jgi:hypothetical protein